MATNLPVNTGSDQVAERTSGGQFAPGSSGNVSGKPRGSRNKTTLAVLSLIEGESEALSRKAVDLALAGDVTALRLCLERIAPPVKERPIESFDMPKIKSIEDVGAALGSVSEALGSGELLPSEALAITNILDKFNKHYELTELEKRVSQLEESV